MKVYEQIIDYYGLKSLKLRDNWINGTTVTNWWFTDLGVSSGIFTSSSMRLKRGLYFREDYTHVPKYFFIWPKLTTDFTRTVWSPSQDNFGKVSELLSIVAKKTFDFGKRFGLK